jgi:glutathione S-transferase
MGGDQNAWASEVHHNGFKVVESIISRTAGNCCFGDDVTLADICLVPQLYNAARFSLDMTEYPTIVRVSEVLKALPVFEAAHPDN